MAAKREGPYTRLRRKASQFATKAVYPKRRSDLYWQNARSGAADIRTLFERADAADTLGFDAVLVADMAEQTLTLTFVEKRPSYIPYEFDC